MKKEAEENYGTEVSEEIKANHVKEVEEKLKIIKELNSIKYPISATVFTHGKSWTIRNESFWKSMQSRDGMLLEFMEKYLIEEK
jgi:hypothetical protein